MSITVSRAVSIFLLGAAVAVLRTRLQWIAFKQKVTQEMMNNLGPSRPPKAQQDSAIRT